MYDVIMGTYTLIGLDCWNIDPNDPPPINPSALFDWARKKILYNHWLTMTPPLPTCPQTSTIIFGQVGPTCYKWAAVVIGSGPGSYQSWQLVGCSTQVCQRTCEVCVSVSEVDPCNAEPMITLVGCSISGPGCNPDPNMPTDCNINHCGS